jgi:hypothetical protein
MLTEKPQGDQEPNSERKKGHLTGSEHFRPRSWSWSSFSVPRSKGMTRSEPMRHRHSRTHNWILTVVIQRTTQTRSAQTRTYLSKKKSQASPSQASESAAGKRICHFIYFLALPSLLFPFSFTVTFAPFARGARLARGQCEIWV